MGDWLERADRRNQRRAEADAKRPPPAGEGTGCLLWGSRAITIVGFAWGAIALITQTLRGDVARASIGFVFVLVFGLRLIAWRTEARSRE